MFVKDIVNDPISYAMVKSINEIGQVMGIQTIAEFVENDQIRAMLEDMGINYGQGYGIERPMPLQEMIDKTIAPANCSGTEYITQFLTEHGR